MRFIVECLIGLKISLFVSLGLVTVFDWVGSFLGMSSLEWLAIPVMWLFFSNIYDAANDICDRVGL